MKRFVFIFCTFFLGSCGFSPYSVDVKPKREPMYNYTQSSNLLECVGGLVDRTNKPGVDIFVSNVPDHTVPTIETSFLTKNAVMMVTTAVDRFNTEKVAVVGKDGGKKERRQLQILGAFTELNRTTKSNALSGQAIIPGGVELSLGTDQNYNHIALDMALSEFNRIVPGSSTSVSVQIHGNSGDATLTYDEGKEYAAVGALGFSAQEGFHAAERLLVETSVALMISKYFDVDLKNCLRSVKRDNAPRSSISYDRPIFEIEKIKKSNASSHSPAPTFEVDNAYYNPFSSSRTSTPRRSPPTSILPEGNNSGPAPLVIYDNNDTLIDATRQDWRQNADEQLPVQNGVVLLPKSYGKRYIYNQPADYRRRQGSYSGQYEDSSPLEESDNSFVNLND